MIQSICRNNHQMNCSPAAKLSPKVSFRGVDPFSIAAYKLPPCTEGCPKDFGNANLLEANEKVQEILAYDAQGGHSKQELVDYMYKLKQEPDIVHKLTKAAAADHDKSVELRGLVDSIKAHHIGETTHQTMDLNGGSHLQDIQNIISANATAIKGTISENVTAVKEITSKTGDSIINIRIPGEVMSIFHQVWDPLASYLHINLPVLLSNMHLKP